VALSDSSQGCPVCGFAQRVPVGEWNQLTVVACPQCGQRYVWPVPSEDVLNAIYDQNYYGGGRGSLGFSDYAALAAGRRRMFSRHLDRIEQVMKAGRVLDVGCATGDFLIVARERGWEPLGIDPSPARDQAKAAGLPIVGHTLQDAEVPPGSIDLVTFWDVLEHVPDPVDQLRRAGELLKPDGLVAITVPNAGGALAKISGRRWFGYKTAGEHLQFFTAPTLQRTFAAAGMAVERLRPVAWSCTVGFLVNRAALYMGPPGRLANRVLADSPVSRMIIDVPQVNQFALARHAA
jgi:2-polyprenyl-3-methyl-5-hydroxy-6-metoxy-1,4-benzoquinol methylase